ncbi:MAG: sulfatase-like hydrolase/transferase [Mailhella sp.]|nr:sulfatase-like hydrolase/transferase [Mailhella sp.]
MKAFSLPLRFVFTLFGYWLLCFSVAFLVMAKREFDDVTVNQILFHMQLMGDNIVTMPVDFINVFFWHLKNSVLCAFTLFFIIKGHGCSNKLFYIALNVILLAAWYVVPGHFMDDVFSVIRIFFVFALLLTLLTHGFGILNIFGRILSRTAGYVLGGWRLGAVWVIVIAYSLDYVHFSDYFRGQTAGDDFYEQGAYVPPSETSVTGSGNKNLLIIYGESIEETFGRTDVMGEDLLAPLRPSIEYPDIHIDQMPGADFTIGGIVGSQCGIPLKSISILSGNLTGWALENYLPGALCLGDYLKRDGYRNVYFNGSSGVFSGLDKFFRTHGYEEFMGKEDWLERGLAKPSDLNTWALYDSDMADKAISRIDQLMAEGIKFSFALSTMDTHEPGFLSPACGEQGFSKNWFGYIRCSMTQVERILHHIREKGWEEDFVILVMGDHLARMPKVDAIDLKHVRGRYVLCSLSRPDGLVPNRREITHFDLFPSLLAALGFSVKGDRLGFGYNVFSRIVMPPSDYLETLRKNVLSRSPTYERLWFPEQGPKP